MDNVKLNSNLRLAGKEFVLHLEIRRNISLDEKLIDFIISDLRDCYMNKLYASAKANDLNATIRLNTTSNLSYKKISFYIQAKNGSLTCKYSQAIDNVRTFFHGELTNFQSNIFNPNVWYSPTDSSISHQYLSN